MCAHLPIRVQKSAFCAIHLPNGRFFGKIRIVNKERTLLLEYLMRIAICDDDKLLVHLLEQYISNWSFNKNLKIETVTFSSAETFLFHWSPNEVFDLIFLDIQMGSMTGVELAEVIRKIDQNIAIVFVTGSREYILDGYNVEALNYLLKPISEVDCHKCLDKVYSRIEKTASLCLLVSIGATTRKIFYDEIYYLESYSHYIVAYTADGEVKFKKNIGLLEEELPETQFVRTHRSYIVNLQYIETIQKAMVILENSMHIPISRNYWQKTNNAFVTYHMPK